MIALNVVTKNAIKELFIDACKKLMDEYEESKGHYRDLIFECENNKTFNVLANLCYMLNNYDDTLADELTKFLLIIGNA